MKKTKRRRRKNRTGWRRTIAIVGALLLAVIAFVIDRHGGEGPVPTWAELYSALGVPEEGPSAETLANSPTTVSVLDVGQGDSVLIGQNGSYCLIDTGTSDSQETLIRSLRQAGVTELDYLVLTHPHADHTGGALAVLENIRVDQLLVPVWETEDGEDPWPRGMWEQAEASGTAVIETTEGQQYLLGEGTLSVLQGGSAWMTGEDDANNGSLCLLFEAGGFRYLATGDAEEESEQKLVDRYGDQLQATVFKAGHHGSSTSNTEALLEVVRPQAVAISCGVDNDYGHPHAEALRRIEDVGAAVYRTDTMGTITFIYDAGVLRAVTSSGELEVAA